MQSFSKKSTTNKWLYLPLEVQFREITSKFLLSCVAAENGYSCILGEGSALYKKLGQLPEGIVYINACGSGEERQKLFDDIKKYEHRIVANDEEVFGLYKNDPSPWLKGRLSKPLFDMIDQYHVWGQRQVDLIQDYKPCNSERFYATGTYRADVWQHPLCEIHRVEADKLRAKYGPYILLSSNFPLRFDPRGVEHHLQLAKDYSEVVTDDDEQTFRKMTKHSCAVGDEFVNALEPISAAFPDHTIIVRPHPTEGVALWKEAIGDIPRVRVVYDGEASPWLLGADAIFHNGCTNAFEARLNGKVPVTYRPISNPSFDETFLFEMGPIADDIEELIQHLKDVISGKHVKANIDAKFHEYVTSSEEELACDRIISAINELNIPPQSHSLSFSNHAYALREKLKLLNLQALSKTTRKSLATNISPPKWPGIHLSEVKLMLKKLQTHLNRFENIEVLDFNRRLFLVRQKN